MARRTDPFLHQTCTVLRGPNAGCVGQVIHYDRIGNEFTIKVEYGADRVVWIWEPRHNTDLIKSQKKEQREKNFAA